MGWSGGSSNPLTLAALLADPSTVSGTGFVYTKTASGIVELQYKDSAGNVTQLTSGGAMAGAPANAQYLTLATNSTLTAERVFTAGTGISVVDGGAGSTYTVSVNQSALDHGSIGGLSDDDHTQYALLAGRSGGQTLIGGTATGDDLKLRATSHATATGSDIIFEANGSTELGRWLNTGELLNGLTSSIASTFQYQNKGTAVNAQYAAWTTGSTNYAGYYAYANGGTASSSIYMLLGGTGVSDFPDGGSVHVFSNGAAGKLRLSCNNIVTIETGSTLTQRLRALSTGGIIIGTATGLLGAELLSIQSAPNDVVQAIIANTNSGTASFSTWACQADSGGSAIYCSIAQLSASYTTSNEFVAAGGLIRATGSGGLSITASNASGAIRLYSGGSTVRWTLDSSGNIQHAPKVSTSGSPTHFLLTGAAHTTLDASTEAADVNWNLARTVQFATGALATQRAFRIQSPTYGFVGASTITKAVTVSISAAPTAGTNATITQGYALEVEAGRALFSGGIVVAAEPTGLAGAVSYTNTVDNSANNVGVGTILMKGATSRNTSGFLKILDGTTARYIPYFDAITG